MFLQNRTSAPDVNPWTWLLLCLHFTGQDAETGGRVQWLSSISQLVPAINETVTLIVNSLLSILLSGLHFLV